jgi:hypothetical protein
MNSIAVKASTLLIPAKVRVAHLVDRGLSKFGSEEVLKQFEKLNSDFVVGRE